MSKFKLREATKRFFPPRMVVVAIAVLLLALILGLLIRALITVPQVPVQ